MNAQTQPGTGASKEAIQRHYDLSNEFYALWLDPTMSYSCAMWEPGDTLERAQIRKIDYHIGAANAARASHILEVGCGWGGVLRRLTERDGAPQATGLTLSEAQARWIAPWRLPRTEVRVESWDQHSPLAPYDAMISVGAFEHFARLGDSPDVRGARYRQFFEWCHRWLLPDSKFSLQTFAYSGRIPRDRIRESRGTHFLSTEIFQETDPPLLEEIVKASSGLFELESAANDRRGYVRTCQAWLGRLRTEEAQARELVGDETYRQFRQYLQLSALAFEREQLDLWRLTLRRYHDAAAVPS